MDKIAFFYELGYNMTKEAYSGDQEAYQEFMKFLEENPNIAEKHFGILFSGGDGQKSYRKILKKMYLAGKFKDAPKVMSGTTGEFIPVATTKGIPASKAREMLKNVISRYSNQDILSYLKRAPLASKAIAAGVPLAALGAGALGTYALTPKHKSLKERIFG